MIDHNMFFDFLTYSNIRNAIVWLGSMVLAATTPTVGLVSALLFAWSFNIWCGMRADGVINIRCKNWSWKKFAHALFELLTFLVVLELVALITYHSGDQNIGLSICKTINYVFAWYYFENGLKNLCKAYPRNRALWIIYLFVRFEFTKLVKIDSLIALYDEHLQKQEQFNNQQSNGI